MTIALALKVGDGLVFGADSAITVDAPQGRNVYTNGEKIFNLVKGLPIGGVFFGLATLQNRSMASLLKDLRVELTGEASPYRLDPDTYTVEDVARHVRRFLYEERYQKEFPLQIPGDSPGTTRDYFAQMGVHIGGYSAGVTQPEVWSIDIDAAGQCGDPVCSIASSAPWGIRLGGQPEAVYRLINGWSPSVMEALVASGVAADIAAAFLSGVPRENLIHPAMPLQDTIELVEYFIKVTAGFVRFAPGFATVAEPIDIAAITPHERFRWVRRKHYFSAELNPPG